VALTAIARQGDEFARSVDLLGFPVGLKSAEEPFSFH
jgi:hypothetical protein